VGEQLVIDLVGLSDSQLDEVWLAMYAASEWQHQDSVGAGHEAEQEITPCFRHTIATSPSKYHEIACFSTVVFCGVDSRITPLRRLLNAGEDNTGKGEKL
jgi:hypothetical protein